MFKRVVLSLIFIAVIFGLTACGEGFANGNLIGVVVRESTGEIVPNPALIVGRTLKSPTIPDQQILGDADGKFDITARGGNYTIQISSKAAGPFYTWPNPIFIDEYKTTVVLLKLPEGY